ncbi:MAG: hypothetical protein ACREJ3_07030, partial [Polyangiaceae bacterium]
VAITFSSLAIVCASGGCSSNSGVMGLGDDASSGSMSTFGVNPPPDSDAAPAQVPCTTGLCTQVRTDCSTTLSGTVYDPAGVNPLYNAVVFVPNDPAAKLPPISPGTHSCNRCDAPVANYVSVATTNSRGQFTLKNVPAGSHIPIVVQMGKWRRTQFLSSVTACTNNTVPASMSRLPRNQGEGDMPQMALLTGGCDDLGCFMKSIGIDASEFSPPGGGGRLDIYTGGDAANQGGPSAPSLSGGRPGSAGNCAGSSCPLWSSKSNLEKYDIVILACECSTNEANKANKQPLHDWLAEGGKAFMTHFQYTWLKDGPSDFQKVANWDPLPSTTPENGPYQVDQSFSKGAALHDWLGSGVALNANGTVPLNNPDVKTSVTTVNPPTLRWVYDSSTNDAKYFSFLTPIGGPTYCGKAVFTDIHTSGGPQGNVPGDCGAPMLTPQQKALEFLFFDLSACVQQDDTVPPASPPPQ